MHCALFSEQCSVTHTFISVGKLNAHLTGFQGVTSSPFPSLKIVGIAVVTTA